MIIKERLIIPTSFRGQRLDRTLSALFPDYSRSKLTSWLKNGVIVLNNTSSQPDEKIRGGEEIIWYDTKDTEPEMSQAEEIPLDIIYEDDSLLIINKPAGLIVHPGAGNPKHTLMNALLFHAPALSALPRAGIVHRLDKETTGLLIVGKTLEAYIDLVRQLQRRDIHREYQALVYGRMIGGGTLTTGYGRDSRNRLKMAVLPHGKEAITHYRILKHYPGATLLEVNLMTGRTHQIRVHMAHLKHAIVGDPLYARLKLTAGLTPIAREALSNFKRQALHACRLTLTHPVSNTPLTCYAPLPSDFQSLLTVLEHAHDSSDC